MHAPQHLMQRVYEHQREMGGHSSHLAKVGSTNAAPGMLRLWQVIACSRAVSPETRSSSCTAAADLVVKSGDTL
jgi:hypothetical protein